MEKPKLGDYVWAELVDDFVPKFVENTRGRSGVFMKDNGDGTIIVKAELETFTCKGPDNVGVIPDNQVVFQVTEMLINQARRELGGYNRREKVARD